MHASAHGDTRQPDHPQVSERAAGGKSTIVGSKTPEEIAALYQGLTNANFMLKVAPPQR